MSKFAIFEPFFELMPQRRPKVFLSFIRNIIIQTLITNDQEILCCDTNFCLSVGKVCQILTNLIFFAYFFH